MFFVGSNKYKKHICFINIACPIRHENNIANDRNNTRFWIISHVFRSVQLTFQKQGVAKNHILYIL